MESSNLPSERESQILRASVVEAAFDLGPKVAKLIFQDSIAEEDSTYEFDLHDQILTPGLTSSTSSEDSHSSLGVLSPIGQGQIFPRTGSGRRPRISPPLKLGAISTTTLAEAYYLESPFVVINKGMFPSSSFPSPPLAKEPQTPPRKTPLKGFRFTPKKREKTLTYEKQESKDQANSATPARPATPSPSTPGTSGATPPRSVTPSSSFSSAYTRVTTTRLRKPKPKDWDFKDADRPSFFMDETFTLRNGSGSDLSKLGRSSSLGRKSTPGKTSPGEDDLGYISEGSGLRSRGKQKQQPAKAPLKRSLSSRFIRKFSGDQDSDSQPTSKQAKTRPLPIASRFATQRDDERIVSSTAAQNEAKPRVADDPRDTMYSSSSSFALVPDLNAAKRLGLDKYPKPKDGAFGSDNELKLEMLKKLLAEKPIPKVEADDLSQVIQKYNVLNARRQNNTVFMGNLYNLPTRSTSRMADVQSRVPYPQSARPEITTHLPPRSPMLHYPLSARPDLERNAFYVPPPPILENQVYAPRAMSVTGGGQRTVQSTRNPVRGRDSPFPVKPVHRKVQQVLAFSPTVSEKYQDLAVDADVPRSVKSSYSKDLEREETESGGHENEDDRSIYSRYTKYMDDETGSRASFMDQEKSERARDMLVGGVFGEEAGPTFQ